MELVISRPASTGDRYITARVNDTTTTTIVVADTGGASAPVYAALNGQTQGFVVYDFHTGTKTTGGSWTDAPDYHGGLMVTGFTDETADFRSYMVGWTLIADVEKPSFLTIFAVPSATRVEVFGDATGLSADGKTYRRVAPPGVDPTTGALSKPNTVLSKRADNRGCMWLWSGYQYVPPQAGHESGGSTTGAQPSINNLGSYHCWNRTYDVFMGRWTTPDPIAKSWPNIWLYAQDAVLLRADPSGLDPRVKFAESATASLGSCGEYSVSVEIELETPAGATGGYLITSCRKGVQVWGCPMQGERVAGNDRIGGPEMTRVDSAYYVPPGGKKATPNGSVTLDSLSDSGDSRPDTHGNIFLACKVFYIDGLTEQDVLAKGFAKDRTFEEVLDEVDPAEITGRRAMRRTASSETDRLGSPGSYKKGSRAPTTYFSLDLDWDCCCNRDDGSLKVRWGDSEKKKQQATGLKVKLKRSGGETTDELAD